MPEVVLTACPTDGLADVELGRVEHVDFIPCDIVRVPGDATDLDSHHGGYGHGPEGGAGPKVGFRSHELCEGEYGGHSTPEWSLAERSRNSALLPSALLTAEKAMIEVMSIHGAFNRDIVTNDGCSWHDGGSASKTRGIG